MEEKERYRDVEQQMGRVRGGRRKITTMKVEKNEQGTW